MPDAVHLRTALGNYPHTRRLKDGEITSPLVTLDFTEIVPIHNAFSPMVRHQSFDLSEMAVVTGIQAVAFGKPIALLPAVVASRMQRGCLIARSSDGPVDPRSLRGKRIGVRAFTQTTGMWVRAALWEDYRLAADDVQWVTHDGPHVEEYRDPACEVREHLGKSLPEQLRDGDIDAAVLGNDLPKGDEFTPVMKDHRATDEAWVARHGFVPINHLVAVSRDVLESHPEAVRAAYDILRQSAREAVRPAGAVDPTRFGIEALRLPMTFILAACRRQRLIEELSVDDLFAPVSGLLAADR